MNTPKLSIIVVNYKTLDLTRQALNTLLKNSPWVKTEAQVIIVDNASNDGSYEALRKEFLFFEVIEHDVNSGFAGGNNIGMKLAKGEYVLLLNSDTISIEEALKPIIGWMDEHKEVGISSIQLLNENRSIQATGGYFPYLLQIFYWMFFIDDLPFLDTYIKAFHTSTASFNKAKVFYTKERALDWVTGAFFLIRKSVIDKVGYFDEQMFMYAEEMEYCYRARKAGFTCRYVPIAKIVHLGGKSSGNIRSPIIGEYKNMLYFYRKHMPSYQLPLVRLMMKLGALLRVVLIGIGKRRKEAINVYIEAFRLV